ncbi:SAM-dependent methyltransferase [Aureliella helgolandensis]|uniref:SAM-dependent methyltransferase n=1 Tax=Aureliella helgolandensis TaxID=2527968 RepID=UPI0018CFF4C9|nr:cyclopropane-fatty-acyl-phospholipid synthase family protein [Aureliella helgolandensis]
MHRQLQQFQRGQLTIQDPIGVNRFGVRLQAAPSASIQVHRSSFYRQVALGGSLGAAESYIRGDWDSPNLTEAMQVLAGNMEALASVERGGAMLMRPLRTATNWLHRNTRRGSRRNISSHYDLSNAFFALMLDPTMTYSSGFFDRAESTLEEASIEKYDRICRKLQLSAKDHVLEIGTGWGGFAEHAAKQYGCRVTTTTISKQQHAYAADRFRSQGLTDQVTLLNQDYRDLCGSFNKLVSIEMIEAVGERYLPEYFAKCSQLLAPDGAMCLQAITIPDHRYERYRRSVDFIQHYIFKGGFLPSMGAIANSVGRKTDFRFVHMEDIGSHYANTLQMWRERFEKNLEAVQSLGFDERFIRTWRYYLSYCEAGFRERKIGVSQLLLSKPGCKLDVSTRA